MKDLEEREEQRRIKDNVLDFDNLTYEGELLQECLGPKALEIIKGWESPVTVNMDPKEPYPIIFWLERHGKFIIIHLFHQDLKNKHRNKSSSKQLYGDSKSVDLEEPFDSSFVSISFAFSPERKAKVSNTNLRDVDKNVWTTTNKKPEGTGLFPGDKTVGILRDLQSLIKAINKETNVVLNPADEQRRRIYTRAFKGNPNVVIN